MLVTSNEQKQSRAKQQLAHAQKRQEKKKWPWTAFLVTSLCIGTIFFTAGSPTNIKYIKGPTLALCSVFLAAGSLLLIPSALIVVILCAGHVMSNLGCYTTDCCDNLCKRYHNKHKGTGKRKREMPTHSRNSTTANQNEDALGIWTVEGDPSMKINISSEITEQLENEKEKRFAQMTNCKNNITTPELALVHTRKSKRKTKVTIEAPLPAAFSNNMKSSLEYNQNKETDGGPLGYDNNAYSYDELYNDRSLGVHVEEGTNVRHKPRNSKRTEGANGQSRYYNLDRKKKGRHRVDIPRQETLSTGHYYPDESGYNNGGFHEESKKRHCRSEDFSGHVNQAYGDTERPYHCSDCKTQHMDPRNREKDSHLVCKFSREARTGSRKDKDRAGYESELVPNQKYTQIEMKNTKSHDPAARYFTNKRRRLPDIEMAKRLTASHGDHSPRVNRTYGKFSPKLGKDDYTSSTVDQQPQPNLINEDAGKNRTKETGSTSYRSRLFSSARSEIFESSHSSSLSHWSYPSDETYANYLSWNSYMEYGHLQGYAHVGHMYSDIEI